MNALSTNYERLLKLRNNPKSLLTDETVQFMAARGGKSTVLNWMLAGILDTVIDHPKRMRGRFVHGHKGRGRRPHRQRVSHLDTPAFRKKIREARALEVGVGL